MAARAYWKYYFNEIPDEKVPKDIAKEPWRNLIRLRVHVSSLLLLGSRPPSFTAIRRANRRPRSA